MSNTLPFCQSQRWISCKICGFQSISERGLKQHCTKKHKSGKCTNSAASQTHPVDAVNRSFLDSKEDSEEDEASEANSLLQILMKAKHAFKILRIVPKGARVSVGEELSKLLRNVTSKNDFASWSRLLLFPVCVLRLTHQKRSKHVSLATMVKQNLNQFQQNDIASLKVFFQSQCNTHQKNAIHGIASKHQVKVHVSKQVSLKLSEGDVRGAVRILCSSDVIAQNCPETLIALESKHPQNSSAANYPPVPVNIDSIADLRSTSHEAIKKAINSFPRSSSGGIDGLRPRHLLDLIMISNSDATRTTTLLDSLAKFVDLVLEGNIPKSILSVFYGASLTALLKKDGGIRPIACGNTLRRVASKIACAIVREESSSKLRPIQLGFGVRGGAEAAVHATRTFLDINNNAEVVIKFDFANAFNTLRRDHMLSTVHSEIKCLYPFIWQAYKYSSKLVYGENILHSECGVQQGDPLGPMLFSLSLMDLTHSLKSELNVWYLDDGTIGGKLADVLDDVKKVIEFSKISGLNLNTTKCEVFIKNGNLKSSAIPPLQDLIPGIKVVEASDFELLGAPVLKSASETILLKKMVTCNLMCTRLEIIDTHSAIYLMKTCLSIGPKLTYLLRCSPLYLHQDLLQRFDDLFRNCLEKITNISFVDPVYNQAFLPCYFGGLGIRRMTDLALPCYLASTHSSVSLVSDILKTSRLTLTGSSEAMVLLNRVISEEEKLRPSLLCSQKFWEKELLETRFNDLLITSDQRSTARLKAVCHKDSYKWLNAIPSTQLGTALSNEAARVCIALRLGATICLPFTCSCGAVVDSSASHGLSCNKHTIGRRSRHESLNQVLYRSLASLQIHSILEPCGTLRDEKRPDGVTLIPWKRGRSLAWDVTVVDTLAPTYICSNSRSCGTAVAEAERRKINKYKDLGHQYIFYPVAFESMGIAGEMTRELIEDIGNRIQQQTGEKRATEFLWQRISIEIQRGNATAILGILPCSAEINSIDRVGVLTHRTNLQSKQQVAVIQNVRSKVENNINKTEANETADVYELHDESDDNNTKKDRLILTIKSPAVQNTTNANPLAIETPAAKPDPSAPNTRKSRRLQERNISRNTVDDTIEDVIKYNSLVTRTVATAGQTQTRRSARQVTARVAGDLPRKSPSSVGGTHAKIKKDRRASQNVEKPPAIEKTASTALRKIEEDAEKSIEKETTKVEAVEPTEPVYESLKAAVLRRIKIDMLQQEPMTLVDPVTGLLTPVSYCEEGEYIRQTQRLANESSVPPPQPASTAEVVEAVQPQQSVITNSKLQSLKALFQLRTEGPCTRLSSGKVGLNNLGNTCYVNSVLQALFMTKLFRKEVLLKSGDLMPLYSKLQILFMLLQYSRRLTLSVNEIVSLTSPLIFQPGHQHDSSEFLGYLLDVLHEQEKAMRINATTAGASERTDNQNQAPTIVQRSFVGRAVTTTRCTACDTASTRADNFRELQLSFTGNCDDQSVQKLLKYYLQQEKLCGDNQYQCDTCQQLTDGVRVTQVEDPPPRLILTLKNFSYNPALQQQTKLLRHVQLDEYIHLKEFNYELYAVIVHFGYTLDSGHYYTFAKDNKNWFKFNDDIVTQTTMPEELFRLKPPETPYILFYSREDCVDPDPLPRAHLSPRLEAVLKKESPMSVVCHSSTTATD